MSGDPGALRAREAIGRRAWAEAREAYQACSDHTAADLESWGLAAYLTGRDDEAETIRAQAHQAYLADGDLDGASRTAFWLGLSLMMAGEPARAGGWFGIMRQVTGDGLESTRWGGYAALNLGMMALFAGRFDESAESLGRALEVAQQYDDLDLRLLAASGHGQALLALGRPADGMSELDGVMVLATSSSASPQAVGQVYCAVISVCRGSLDLERGSEWTEALSRWCDTQPDLMPYRGQCLVHRSEVLQVRGRWDEAITEAERVLGDDRRRERDVALGMALYQRAELHRVRGDDREAERGYREALAAGHDPQPGLALLRLAQGKGESALLSLQRALGETGVPFLRVRLLPALVEVALAVGDLTAAEVAVNELEDAASRLGSIYARAMAATSAGALAIAEGRSGEALGALRAALADWARLDAPYDAARCRLLLARACQDVGDLETAELERAAARVVFTDLGAERDLAGLPGSPQAGVPAGLTPREVEVLRLVATGASNREVAAELVLSEKTVARHVANIFVKIGVSSRSAATAFAYDENLV
ncbi:LuxR family transcriptional regulator [Nocardioides marmorisolisilvae]|uniref:LuxR family transcriptional regulator n=1 Tax=Nocardioides marmorisolisilvae TaxID=1542737 RepID=A0A3N0DXS0_9ACTN|nr:LuxR family transcriptional regulator [Nocardioides marmorisolisilvae]RNL80263.1 LuxR family transcriptional regulator [Nocardioides marmorisolisilvae]